VQRRNLEPTYVSELLSWGAMVHAGPPTVILNKDGSYMATLTYRGQDVEMMEGAEHAQYVKALSTLFGKLGTGWCVLSDEWHEEATAYPPNTCTNPVAAFVDDSRQVLFGAGLFFESTYFVTVLWQPPPLHRHTWYEQLFRATAEDGGTHDEANLTAFLQAIVRWSDPLDLYFPAWHWCSPDETATYLHRTVSWDRSPVAMPDPPVFLANALTDSGFVPGHTSQLGRVIPDSWPVRLEKYLRPLCIKSWPTTDPRTGKGGLGLLVPSALASLPFSYRYTVRSIPLVADEADEKLRQYQGEWATMIWGRGRLLGKQTAQAEAHIASLDQALTQTAWDGMGGHGYVTPTVLVWAGTAEELGLRERAVLKLLQQQGLVMVAEDINSAQAWQGMCPGDYAHNCRRPLLSSLVPGALFSHHANWAGQARDAHFKAAPLFQASSGMTPYRYVMHVGESASTMVIGRHRSGKSGKMSFMAMQFLRYLENQVFLFDRDWGFYCATLMVGGAHYDLGEETALGFQPLGKVDQGYQELVWAQSWIETLFVVQDMPLTPADKHEIWEALKSVANKPRELRTLSCFQACLQVQRLKPALASFVGRGPYAFLDATHDSFRLARWTCFEMKKMMENMPAALPHVMSYIFHDMEAVFTGRPTLVIYDEAHAIFTHPVFQAPLLSQTKTAAKKNVAMVWGTQDISDASRTPLWQSLLNQCDNKLFTANPMATSEDILPEYLKCGVTPFQAQLIAHGVPAQDYFHLTTLGARMFQLRLSPVERLLCAASRPEEIAALRQLKTQEAAGELKEPLAVAWLRSRQYGREADLLQTYCDRSEGGHVAYEPA
jgi:type IV secretory pathway VirB4 component